MCLKTRQAVKCILQIVTMFFIFYKDGKNVNDCFQLEIQYQLQDMNNQNGGHLQSLMH